MFLVVIDLGRVQVSRVETCWLDTIQHDALLAATWVGLGENVYRYWRAHSQ
jgi:hypothetical protein